MRLTAFKKNANVIRDIMFKKAPLLVKRNTNADAATTKMLKTWDIIHQYKYINKQLDLLSNACYYFTKTYE